MRVRVEDALSPIESAELVAAGATLAQARPIDGVLDSRVELLEVTLPGTLPEGLTLRVRDASGNEASLSLSR